MISDFRAFWKVLKVSLEKVFLRFIPYFWIKFPLRIFLDTQKPIFGNQTIPKYVVIARVIVSI